jgi:hypothetical protein
MTDTLTPQEEAPETGIVERLARDDVERKRFLKKAAKGIGGGAVATSLAAFIAACGSSSSSSTTSSSSSAAAPAPSSSTTASSTSASSANAADLKIVNYALTLEYLESEFYSKVAAAGLFKGATLTTLKLFGSEEADHVTALHALALKLGGPAAPKPKGKFPVKSAASVATLAATVENLGASAYLGQAPLIQSPEVLAAALSIHSIEARHAATLNLLTKMNPTPNGAFAKPSTMAEVLKAVTPFIA